MGKKKKQKKIIQNSGQLVNASLSEIDYEKLAVCIAKAMVEENDKRVNAYSVTRELMKFIVTPVFWAIAVLMMLFAVAFFVVALPCLEEGVNTSNFSEFFKGLISFLLSLISLGVALFSFFAGKEFDKEKDRQFVVAVFSGMVSLAALIVALVALVRG